MKKIIDCLLINNEVVPFSVWESENISHTPAVPLFLRTWAEIMEQGFTEPMFIFKNANRVVWVENEEKKVIAGICFDYLPARKTGFLVLSFTDPDYRGKGLNKICHDEVVTIVKKLGGKTITSNIHVDNTSMYQASLKSGMKPELYKMSKKI